MKYEAQRVVKVAMAMVVAFSMASAGAAALAIARVERERRGNDDVPSGTGPVQNTRRQGVVAPAPLAHATTRVMIGVAAFLAAAHLLLVVFAYNLIARELTCRQAEEVRLEILAMTDPLTGLANRRALETALESALLRAKRHDWDLSVILLDVDHFKGFNDGYGHELGDEVLRAVARVLRSALRAGDVAGRYGGEEFLVVLPEADWADAVRTAERIRSAVSRLELPLPPVTISLGVATLGNRSASAAALVAEADQALYVSKRSGRDRVTHLHDGARVPVSRCAG